MIKIETLKINECLERIYFSDADFERLYEQWEESDEPLPVDELPEWHPDKPRPEMDVSKMSQFKDPEELLKFSKKGKSLMMFVKVCY